MRQIRNKLFLLFIYTFSMKHNKTHTTGIYPLHQLPTCRRGTGVTSARVFHGISWWVSFTLKSSFELIRNNTPHQGHPITLASMWIFLSSILIECTLYMIIICLFFIQNSRIISIDVYVNSLYTLCLFIVGAFTYSICMWKMYFRLIAVSHFS